MGDDRLVLDLAASEGFQGDVPGMMRIGLEFKTPGSSDADLFAQQLFIGLVGDFQIADRPADQAELAAALENIESLIEDEAGTGSFKDGIDALTIGLGIDDCHSWLQQVLFQGQGSGSRQQPSNYELQCA